MLNQPELFRGMSEVLTKHALMPLDSQTAGAPAVAQSKSMLEGLANPLGTLYGKFNGRMMEDPSTSGNSFTKGFRQGAQDALAGSKGVHDFGNRMLNESTGGSFQLDDNNKAHLNFGNAIQHFGGQAFDWIKNNPGTAALGGGALLGGGMLLHHALSGNSGSNQTEQEQEPIRPAEPLIPNRRFAFAKPGITG